MCTKVHAVVRRSPLCRAAPQGSESPEFLKLFPRLRYMAGGYATGFRDAAAAARAGPARLYQVKSPNKTCVQVGRRGAHKVGVTGMRGARRSPCCLTASRLVAGNSWCDHIHPRAPGSLKAHCMPPLRAEQKAPSFSWAVLSCPRPHALRCACWPPIRPPPPSPHPPLPSLSPGV